APSPPPASPPGPPSLDRSLPDLAARRALSTIGDQRAIAAADLDGDGKLDLAVPNRTSANSVSLFFGVGHGNFGPRVDLPAGTSPYAVALADVSGDRVPDVVVTNEGDDTVTVFIQDALHRGSFPTTRTLAVGQAPAGVAVADIDGDGLLDIVTANSSSGTGGDVSILLQDPAHPGTFKPASSVPSGAGSCAVAIADLDGDGAPDLVVVNERDNTISLLFQSKTTRGTFGAPVVLATGTGPVWLAVADLAQHNRFDIAVANRDSGTISVFLQGSTPGTFPGPPLTIAVGTQPYWVAAADVNGDTKTDLVVANHGSGNVEVLLQGAPGTFSAGVTVSAGTPDGVAIGDLDGDGAMDLAISAEVTGQIVVALGDKKNPGGFLDAVDDPTGSSPRHVITADLNGDGLRDLVVANQHGNTVSVLLQDPASPSSFLPATNYATGVGPSGVAIADLNGDGRPDLVVPNLGDGTVQVFLQDPAHPGSFLAPTTYTVGANPACVVVADLDHDGRPDLAVALDTNSKVMIMLQDPANPGKFLPGTSYGAGAEPQFLALGDLNGDGWLDIATANPDSGTASVSILLADPAHPGAFLAPTVLTGGTTEMSVVVADLDGDGKLDVVASSRDSNDVSVWRGKGDGTFGPRSDFPTAANAWDVRVADMNGDGRPDLVVAEWGAGSVFVLLQDPANPGSFLPGPRFLVGGNPSWLEVADFSGSGKLDLAVANWGSADVQVLLGR
ncbi:MAG TPA: VCBS repeat-containing protein, partial [Planctomycetota bacterium]|nr:VCBS repeat-containing protein [Planctomycetota bacterium]